MAQRSDPRSTQSSFRKERVYEAKELAPFNIRVTLENESLLVDQLAGLDELPPTKSSQ